MLSELATLRLKLSEYEKARVDADTEHSKQMLALEARLRAEAREIIM